MKDICLSKCSTEFLKKNRTHGNSFANKAITTSTVVASLGPKDRLNLKKLFDEFFYFD